MFDLPLSEIIAFVFALAFFFAAGCLGALQLARPGEKYRFNLSNFISLGVLSQAMLLTFRAAEAAAIPLTGLFDAMIVLTILLAAAYMLLGMVFRQVYFGSIMSWFILALMIIMIFIAEPVSVNRTIAGKHYAVIHGLAMILAETLVLLATASAWLYIVGSKRLKQKKISRVLGIVPNLGKLQSFTVFSLWIAFCCMTVGVISGIVMSILDSKREGLNFMGWFFDYRFLVLNSFWLWLLIMLCLQRFRLIKTRKFSYMTIVTFIVTVLLLAAAMLTTEGMHDFKLNDINTESTVNNGDMSQ